MQGFAGFVQSWFPAFMLGAIFGKLMECTNMAKSVALGISRLFGPKRAIIAAVVAGSILTYGGVSMFVAVFGLYPICLVLFRQADIPRRLIPATITVGVFEYTMVCLPGSPLISLAVAANILCGATGSASGGLTITLSTLAERYIMIAQQTGIPVEVMHRIVAIAAGMMDTVPHNGAILTLLAVCGMTHKDSYPDIAVCTIGMPMLSLIFGIILASLGVLF